MGSRVSFIRANCFYTSKENVSRILTPAGEHLSNTGSQSRREVAFTNLSDVGMLTYSGIQANQAHPSPQTLDPVLTQMYWTQLNNAI